MANEGDGSLNQPHRLHAAAALAADDDVIVDGNAHVAAGFDEVAGEADVRIARKLRIER